MLLWNKAGKGIKHFRFSESDDGKCEISATISLEDLSDFKLGDIVRKDNLNFVVDSLDTFKQEANFTATIDLDCLKTVVLEYSEEKTVALRELFSDLRFVDIVNAADVTNMLNENVRLDSDLSFDVGTAYDLFKKITQLKQVGISYVSNQNGRIACKLKDMRLNATMPDHLAHRLKNILSLNTRTENYTRYNCVLVLGKGIQNKKSNAKAGESEKIKVIKDERFSDQAALDSYAEALLSDYTTPFSEINVTLAGGDDYKLLDSVQVLDPRCNVNTHYITSIEQSGNGYVRVTLANKRQNLADIFKSYREEQKQLQLEYSASKLNNEANFNKINSNLLETKNNFISEMAKAKEDFTSEIAQAKFEVNNAVARAQNNLSYEINNLQHEFKQELVRTERKMVSKYEEVVQSTNDTVKELKTKYSSQISQTARDITAEVRRVEQRAINADNKADSNDKNLNNFKQETHSKFKIQADNISSVVYDYRNVNGKVSELESKYQQTVNSFSWSINDLKNRANNVSMRLDSWGLSIRGGNLYVSRTMYADTMIAETVKARRYEKR